MQNDKRSYGEWIMYFIEIDLLLLAVLFFIVPVHPWWLYLALWIIVKFIGPAIMGKGRGRRY